MANNFDTECPHCHKGINWEDIKAESQPADIQGMFRFLKQQTGAVFDDLNITEAFHVECACGGAYVVAQIPEACEPDENGWCAPAHMTLALVKKEGC